MSRLLQRWWWVVLLVPLVIGLVRVRFEIEVLNLLPDEVQEVHGLKLYQKHFTNSRELLLTVRGKDAEAAEFAARMIAGCLREQTNLSSSSTWQPPWLEHPEQMAELVACMWLNQPPEIFRDLTNRLAPDKLVNVLADTREQLTTSMSPLALGRLGYDPFGLTQLFDQGQFGGFSMGESQDWFSSPDGTLRVVYIEAPGFAGDYRTTGGWLEKIRSEVTRCETQADWPQSVTVRYTGAPAFVSEIAAGMEHDMKSSVAFSLILVVGLFWWAHRSWRPLLWLCVFLGLIVLGTLAAGGLIWGKVNAVSMGFAAILLGLAVDYALVLYQEAIAAPHLPAQKIRQLLAPSIFWSAVTTASAFGLLMFAGMPGLAQLGSLVAIGILLSAGVMLYGFLPVLLRGRVDNHPPATALATAAGILRRPVAMLAFSVVVALLALGIFLWNGWQVDHSTSPLQPKHCPAQIAFDELDKEMNRQGQPRLLILAGRSEEEVAQRLDQVEARLLRAKTNQQISRFMLPTGLWPHTSRAQTNLLAAGALFAQLEGMKTAVQEAGFTPEAMSLTETVLTYWQAHAGTQRAIWPTNQSSRWILKRAAAWTGDEWLASGMALASTNTGLPFELNSLHADDSQVWVTGWSQLAEVLLGHVENRLGWLVVALVGLVTGCLWLAFHRWSEVFLSFATLGFSLLLLLSVMGLAGWSWNLMSLMSIPLLLGAGVDYTIHIQLALRRHGGDIRGVRKITGRAVFLCAATTVAGFGSNAFSSNAGLAALGSVCAVGIALVYLSAAYLLPAWWIFIHSGEIKRVADRETLRSGGPSTFYRAWVWHVGRTLVRWLPEGLCNWAGRLAACCYGRIHPGRRAVVEQNLLPVLGGDAVAARQTAQRLYANFGVKMAQLLRWEAGCVGITNLAQWSGWELFTAAKSSGRGVLIITPHLGDWELGGYLLARHGVRLLVLTQPEPGTGFTELRQQSRARWGIETLVVGQDAFAFVEIIKRLQEGAVVALLVDRPPPPTAVSVELFGRPFRASVAAAELARASGCAVLPVYLVHHRSGSEAHVLPEIAYDRRELGDREARRQMTQRIMRAFAPVIKQHADQWYHFVPLWPAQEKPQTPNARQQ